MNDHIISSRRIFRGWMNFDLVTAKLAGEVVERAFVEHPSGAVVLAFDPSRRVAFVVQQTRLAVLREDKAPLWEPAGGGTEGEDPEDTARREALEEVGLNLRHLELIGRAWITPSSSTERVSFYLAEYGADDREDEGGGADGENEDLHIAEVPLTDLWASVERGEFVDMKLMMLLQALKLRRPELFGS